jgi:hypothetical protein
VPTPAAGEEADDHGVAEDVGLVHELSADHVKAVWKATHCPS